MPSVDTLGIYWNKWHIFGNWHIISIIQTYLVALGHLIKFFAPRSCQNKLQKMCSSSLSEVALSTVSPLRHTNCHHFSITLLKIILGVHNVQTVWQNSLELKNDSIKSTQYKKLSPNLENIRLLVFSVSSINAAIQ